MNLSPTKSDLSSLTDADYLSVCLDACDGMGLSASDFELIDGPSMGATIEDDAAWGVRVYSYPDGGIRRQMGIGWQDGKLDLYWN